jgi:transposase-like protein
MVNGASVNQIAKHFGISRTLVRSDIQHVVEELNARDLDRVLAIREEIVARQRELIFANMPRARIGDKAAATIIQNAENIIASVTGVRYLRPDPPPHATDPTLAAALEAYTTGILDATHK